MDFYFLKGLLIRRFLPLFDRNMGVAPNGLPQDYSNKSSRACAFFARVDTGSVVIQITVAPLLSATMTNFVDKTIEARRHYDWA